MVSELKLCPCCGRESYTNYSRKTSWCYNEDCCLYDVECDIEKWNSRPEEDRLNARIEELERKLSAYYDEIHRLSEQFRYAGSVATQYQRIARDHENRIEELETALMAIKELISSNYLMSFPDIKRASMIISEVLAND